MKKQICSLLALCLALCLLLASCGTAGAEPALFTVVRDAVSGFFSQSQHLLRGNTPLIINGAGCFALEDNTGNSAAHARLSAMLAALTEKTGATLQAVAEDTRMPRLRVGVGLKPDLSAGAYFIGFFEGNLLITAQNEPLLEAAIAYFEESFVLASEDGNALYLPSSLAYQSPTLPLVDEDGDPLYSICYPENADATTMAAISTLRNALRDAIGVNFSFYNDFITLDEEDEVSEILVGGTNRTASIASGEGLTLTSYYIGVENGSIVINASSGFMLKKAVEQFIALFLPEGATPSLPTAFSFRKTEDLLILSNNSQSDYTLIYPADIDELSFSYIKDFLRNFRKLTGATIPAYADDQLPASNLTGGSREIQVGATNRPGAVATAGAGVVLCAGSDIKILATDANNLRFALESFYQKILSTAQEQNAVDEEAYYRVYPVVALDRFPSVTVTNAPNVPRFTDIIDIGESAYMLYKNSSSLADYTAYINALKSLGYTQHDAGTAATLRHATLYSDDEILNVTFTEADSILRVTVDPRSEAALQPLTATRHNGKSDVDPLFIQLGGMNSMYATADCGMSYVIRLTDGTFVVVDGGVGTERIAEDLYDTLQENNKLGGKPVIACWIFTHAHSDHIAAFRKFTDKYFDKVTLQSVLYSFPTDEQAAIHGGNWVVQAQQTFRNYIAEYGKGVTVYKARTGQQYQFADCTLEMLFTFEDYAQPKELSYFNDSSIVFRMTLSDEGQNAQRFMMLGDCSESSAPILVARYGDYLKSDAVQVAHHGYAGGTEALYDAISAAVVFWPCPLYDPRDGVDVDKRFNNPKWSKVTRVMLGKDYAVALYVSGLGDVALTLPQIKDRAIIGIGMTAESAKYPS